METDAADIEGLLEQLTDVLSDHCSAYRDLSVLLSAQTEALQKNDLSELSLLLRSQEELVSGITASEERRKGIQSQLAEKLQVRDNLLLSELLEMPGLPEGPGQRLSRLRENLVELTEQVRELNQENHELVQQALKFIGFSLDGLKSLAAGPDTYAGEDEDGISNSLMMDKKM